jgi:hypothetical protein
VIEKAINKILELGKSLPEIVGGRIYQNGPGGLKPLLPPSAERLNINTLTGIVDFDPASFIPGVMIQVVDHKTVEVIDKGFSDAWLKRSTYLSAVHESPVFKFGQYYYLEDFIINMQAMFVQDENTAEILKIVGNLKDESVKNIADNGITQTVTAKVGISMSESVPLPNPVTLRPYRTFMEIEQPASTFVFRMHSGRGTGNPPTCALFEADGRMWRLEAIKNIKEWLAGKLPGIKIIA